MRPIDMFVRRWLVPLAIAVVVLGLVGGAWLLGRGDGSSTSAPPMGSSGPFSPGPVSPTPVSPPSHITLPNSRTVAISGYAAHGTTLTLQYAMGVVSCYGRLDRPEVEQTSSAVTVTLRLLPPRVTMNKMCPQLMILKTIKLALDAPLGDRVVIDGSTGHVVPEGITRLYRLR